MTDHRLKKDQRVRLKKDGQDNIYAYAASGSEGWVRKLDHDNVGFPMVFIEWDTDHWAYNGEKNQWTLEDHFEPVEDTMGNEDQFREFQEFLAWKENQGKSEDKPSEDTQKALDYDKEIESALEFAKNANAFLLIAVESDIGSDTPAFNPKVFNFYKDEATGLILESQLAQLVAQGYHFLTLQEVKRQLEQ